MYPPLILAEVSYAYIIFGVPNHHLSQWMQDRQVGLGGRETSFNTAKKR